MNKLCIQNIKNGVIYLIETVRIMIDFNERKYEALAKKMSKNSRIGSVFLPDSAKK